MLAKKEDVNDDTLAAQEPLERTDSKTVCCWCCQSGPITARCWLAQTGYAPGQAVLFNGHVDNKSRSPLVATRLELVEVGRPSTSVAVNSQTCACLP